MGKGGPVNTWIQISTSTAYLLYNGTTSSITLNNDTSAMSTADIYTALQSVSYVLPSGFTYDATNSIIINTSTSSETTNQDLATAIRDAIIADGPNRIAETISLIAVNSAQMMLYYSNFLTAFNNDNTTSPTSYMQNIQSLYDDVNNRSIYDGLITVIANSSNSTIVTLRLIEIQSISYIFSILNNLDIIFSSVGLSSRST